MLIRLFLIAIIWGLAWGVQAKDLYWPQLIVDARLDAEGVLHVSETQTINFNGAWNGGERIFNIRGGQSLQFMGLERIDGEKIIPLVRGKLDAVDHYDFTDAATLRWRSRLLADPEFENTQLTYRIHYAITGVLRGRDRDYQLVHDFGFPDRTGVIQRFKLNFTIDAPWSGLESPISMERANLEPGSSVIVRGTLTHAGASPPRGVVVLPQAWIGQLFFVVLVLGLLFLVLRFLSRERGIGRLGALAPSEPIDAQWLRKNVFTLKPEVVGAAWDGKVGGAEVAAVLATLAQEQKIRTTVEKRLLRRPKLVMQLTANRENISGYQGDIVNRLFFGKRDNTDTDAIQAHYKKTGLDLVGLIEGPINRQLEQIPGWKGTATPVRTRINLAILGAAFASLFVAAIFGGPNASSLTSSVGFDGLCCLACGSLAAYLQRRAIDLLWLRFLGVAVCVVPLLYFSGLFMWEAAAYRFEVPELIAGLFWTFAVVHVILELLRIDELTSRIALRRKLLGARHFLRDQLGKRDPDLRDAWFPYLLALGLGPAVDRWFRVHGVSSAQANAGDRVSSASSSQSSQSAKTPSTQESSGWSAGGGAFGGAGASGSWVAAAAVIGAGVSSPDSSSGSSSSSSSSGGSSSGGGGGGGW